MILMMMMANLPYPKRSIDRFSRVDASWSPVCVKTTSSTKPEVHNITQRSYDRRQNAQKIRRSLARWFSS